MKIVKRNEVLDPRKWEARCECGSCRSILDLVVDDLTRVYDDDPRDHDVYAVFQCPVCQKYNDVDVPKDVMQTLRQGQWHEVCAHEPLKHAKIIPTRGSVV